MSLEPARRPKLDCRLVQRAYSQTDISNDDNNYTMKIAMKNEKTKPENPGLTDHLKFGFGFEKCLCYSSFRVRSNPGCKP